MITKPVEVCAALALRIQLGYDPEWNYESADDHGVDWLAIPKAEFYDRKRAAQARVLRSGRRGAKRCPPVV